MEQNNSLQHKETSVRAEEVVGQAHREENAAEIGS